MSARIKCKKYFSTRIMSTVLDMTAVQFVNVGFKLTNRRAWTGFTYNKDMYFVLQFFDHPVIIDFLKDSWRGNSYEDDDISAGERVFFSVCCVFDVFIFPLIFLLTSVVGNIFYSIGFHKDSLSLGSIPRQASIFRFLYSTVLVVHFSAKIMFSSICLSAV